MRTSLAAFPRSPNAGTGRAKALLTSLTNFSVEPNGLGISELKGDAMMLIVMGLKVRWRVLLRREIFVASRLLLKTRADGRSARKL